MAHFAIPSHVLTGKGSLADSGPYLSGLGSKAFIVTGKHVGRSPMAAKLKKVLGENKIGYEVFDGITGEPTDAMIEEGLGLYKESGCDFVIGIGGGSPIDSAKAIAAMSVLPGSIADFNGKPLAGTFPPIVAVPTTAGTGSEATKFTIITDLKNDIKMLLAGDALVPQLAILEPEFTLDMPKSVTAATGLDALTHVVEAYTSRKALALTDAHAIQAVKRIMKYLPAAYSNGYDFEAREQMQIAALEGGICINNSSVTIVHGMSRPIGALFHVAHGMSNAMLLKDCLGFALPGAYERFGTLGREIGAASEKDSDQTASEALLDKIGELCDICEIPTLREYGITEEQFEPVIEKMAGDAIASGSPGNTRREVTKEDCMNIYRQVFDR